MKALAIALKDTKIRFRDFGALMLMLVAPLILLVIVAAAFSHLGEGGSAAEKESLTIIVVNHEQGDGAERFIKQLQKKLPLHWPSLKYINELHQARKLLDQGKAQSLVYIPNHMTDALHQSAGVLFYSTPTAEPKAKQLNHLVKQIVNETNSAVVNANLATLIGYKQALSYVDKPGFDYAQYLTSLRDKVNSTFFKQNERQFKLERNPSSSPSNEIQIVKADPTEPMLNQLAYMTVGLMVFFLFFSMFDNVISLLSEFKQGTYYRMQVAGTSIGQILLGKIFGAFLIGQLQIGCLILATRLLFGLEWGQSISGLLLMSVVTVAAITSLGTFVSAFVSNINQANILAGTLILVFAALGGSFYQTSNFPSWLQYLSYLTINRWAIDGFVDIVIFQSGVKDILYEASILAGMTLLLFILGIWKFTRCYAKQ